MKRVHGKARSGEASAWRNHAGAGVDRGFAFARHLGRRRRLRAQYRIFLDHRNPVKRRSSAAMMASRAPATEPCATGVAASIWNGKNIGNADI
jgi:hypothetical protein